MGISSALSATGAVPVGVVNPFAGANAPAGWLLCFGQTVSRTAYPVLFTTLGTTYGAGDGSTTFAIPDMRGRAVAGVDDMGGTAASRLTNAVSGVTGTTLGAVGGNQVVHAHSHVNTLTNNAVTSGFMSANSTHGHTSSYGTSAGVAGNSVHGGKIFAGSASTYENWVQIGETEDLNHSHEVTSNVTITNATFPATGGGSSQNVQPTIVLNYIIKAL
jgi:microcystin-dependent protein